MPLAQFLLSASNDLPPGQILDFSPALLVEMGITFFNVAVLTFILIKILYNPVKNFMAKRAERIKNEIDAASQATQEALELKTTYEGHLANIGEERDGLLKEAHHAAIDKSDRIVFAAREEAKHLISKARAEIAAERENATEDMKQQIIELSTFLAGRFVELSIDKDTRDRYVEEALADWSDHTWQT